MICGVTGSPWPAVGSAEAAAVTCRWEAIVRWEKGSHLTLRWSAVLMRKLIALSRFIFRRLGRGRGHHLGRSRRYGMALPSLLTIMLGHRGCEQHENDDNGSTLLPFR
jgi:hypothetical protein